MSWGTTAVIPLAQLRRGHAGAANKHLLCAFAASNVWRTRSDISNTVTREEENRLTIQKPAERPRPSFHSPRVSIHLSDHVPALYVNCSSPIRYFNQERRIKNNKISPLRAEWPGLKNEISRAVKYLFFFRQVIPLTQNLNLKQHLHDKCCYVIPCQSFLVTDRAYAVKKISQQKIKPEK